MINSVWGIYFSNVIKQEYDSKGTARRQIPRTVKVMDVTGLSDNQPKLLDLGCGRDNDKHKAALVEKGVEYYGCDPFNQPFDVNMDAIDACMGGGADIVVINNVLNTIKEREVWSCVLQQAADAVNPETGRVLIVVYEGAKLSSEKNLEAETGIKLSNLTPIETRDGWQNRFKTEEYLDAVRAVFPNVQLENMPNCGGKVIVAAVNPELSLDLKKMAEEKLVTS